MKRIAITLSIMTFYLSATGAVPVDFRSIESRSGQFLVRWLNEFRVPPLLLQDEERAGIIILSPELLTVSAERIKEGLLQQLGDNDRWRGKIRFHFAKGKSNPNLFQVNSNKYSNGWQYHVKLSPKIKREVWLRGCVAVCLLEMANRMAGDRSAEVPIWLIDGIATELQESALVDLSPNYANQVQIGGVNPGLGQITPTQRRFDPLVATRRYLGSNVPVSVAELFVPTSAHISGEKRELFRRSSHFFFRQLAALPAGKASLLHFLGSVSGYLNWQQAFFPSFEERFTTMLELEKWWSVALTDLTQLTPVSSWSIPDSLAYLDRIIHPAALVGKNRNELAQRKTFSLQEMVTQWDYADQRTTLEQTMNRLRVLSIYCHPKLRQVVAGYSAALSNYVQQRQQVGFEPDRRGQGRLRASRVIDKATKEFNRLDRQKEALR